ncbi:MAK10-like protein [Tanacetum coccineum]
MWCLFDPTPSGWCKTDAHSMDLGSITTWEDLTTRFLAQFFPPGRTTKLRNDILMFQQHQGESLSEAWTRFKDLLQKLSYHGIDLWLQDLALYDNESWNDPRDFAKPVKAISLPQDVPSTFDCRLIELENQVQRLMEAYIAPMQPNQVNKITSSCEICSGPHDTKYCIENPEQAFVEYASSRTDEAGGKWYTFKPEQNNFGDTYNPSWRSHPNLRWRQPQNSQNKFSNPPNRFQPNSSIPNRSFNNNPQNFNNQSNLEGLVSNFMASQDARLSKFVADFKQQQSEMTNKIDTVLMAITDRIAGALPSDTVKNPKLNVNSTTLVLSARSYPMEDPQCSSQIHSSINAVTICPKQPNKPQNDESEGEDREERSNPKNIDTTPPLPHDPSISFIIEKVRKLNSFLKSSGLVPQSSDTEIVCTKGDDGDVMFIEIIRKNDDSHEKGLEDEGVR